MRHSATLCGAHLLVGLVLLGSAPAGAQLAVGNRDTFEDGTTQNWAINLLGMGSPPASTFPRNVPTGGPAGLSDNYLQLTSTGVPGAGGRLTSINFMGQWAGDYLAAGINGIRLDAINLGTSDVALRLLFENPIGGPPTDVAVSSTPFNLPVGSGWTSVFFPLFGPGGLVVLDPSMDLHALLSNTTAIRLFHSPTVAAVGPPIAAQIGVDNITATPEPATLLLVVPGLALLARRRRRA